MRFKTTRTFNCTHTPPPPTLLQFISVPPSFPPLNHCTELVPALFQYACVSHTSSAHLCASHVEHSSLSSAPIFLTPLITDHSTVVIICIICYNDGKEEEYSHQQRREEKEGGIENESYGAAGRPVNISETSLREA